MTPIYRSILNGLRNILPNSRSSFDRSTACSVKGNLAVNRSPSTNSGNIIYFTTYLVLAPLMKVVSRKEVKEAKTILNKTKPSKLVAQPLIHFEEAILSKMSKI